MAGINVALSQAEADERSQYSYEPLQHANSIRLLSLFPGDMKSPIRISLAEVRSEDDHPYEALSYTWATDDGDCRPSSQIRCDGARIWVTRNCELALRYLRKSDTKRTLWVDAICINQKDDKERGHQVGIMQDVYSNAIEVLIWLGLESEDTGVPLHVPDSAEFEAGTSDSSSASTLETALRRTFNPDLSGRKINDNDRGKRLETTLPVSEIFLEFLGRVAAEVNSMQSAGQDPRSSPLYQELLSQVHTSTTGRVKTDLYRGLRNIMKRRWWTRIWVVQEVVVARSASLVCSKLSTSYNDFYDWYRLLNDDRDWRGVIVMTQLSVALTHARSVTRAREVYTDDRGDPSRFMRVLRRVRYLHASDPRDNIFGVLGLSDRFRSLSPMTDYGKTPTEVFTEVAKSLLEQTKSLSILLHATSATPVLDHPSWVPYWSNLPVMKDWPDLKHQASGDSKAIFAISPNDKELRVKGQKFDRVKKLPLADMDAYERSGAMDHCADGLRISCDVGLSLRKYPTGEPVEEVLWRTLCWNSDSKKECPKKKTEIAFREWYRILQANDTNRNILRNMRKQEHSFDLIVNSTTPLCTTVNGYLAAVPFTTKAGDFIAVLAGGNYPFVLRQTEDHYQLVGPCYVHGVMGGEAFPADPEELEWFSIR